MKTALIRIVIFASMSSIWATSGHATTKITSLPFTISTSGTYIFAADLTYTGTNQTAITVNASNVVVDLKGHTLAGSDLFKTGIAVSNGTNNVTVQNGSINGFGICVDLAGTSVTVQNLRLATAATGVVGEQTCLFGMIQNCYIVGGGPNSTGIGIFFNGGARLVVKNNQIVNESDGCFSGGGNIFIANYIENCSTGLFLSVSDKYQGNVTMACPTAFNGGVAVGTENN